MAQTNYTPISLYHSTTALAVPVNTNLVNGELAINITDGKLYYKDNGGTVRLLASKDTTAGAITSISVASSNGLAGTSSGGTTPTLTLSTTITGVLKGNGTAISAAVSGTDYAPATSGTSILYGNGSGGFSNVTVGSGLSFAGGTLSSSGGSGTVTSVAQSFTGGIISVSGSPITTSGTLALTVAGTSGGIPYFSSDTTWASSAALAANALVVGGGAGAAPATITTGTGVVTALGVNTGSAGAFVVNGGALGTPSSGTLTNATGLPVSTGVSGLGTGVATALAVNTGSAGAFVVNGGDLGTPSSGTVTNLTGTASININGTVGATTANTGAFTTLSATGVTTVQAGTVSAPAITTSGDTNTGIFFPAADTIAFTEGGVEVMRINSSANVGIQTTTPGSALDVKGTLRLSGSSSGYVGLSPAAAAGSTTYTLPAADGTTGQVLSTNGSGALSWATAGGGGFTAGTLMLFQQTSAPTGWTKQTTHDNKALRVVSGSAGSGGSVAFTTAFASQGVSGTVGSTTLSTSQIPSHSHGIDTITGTDGGGGNSGVAGYAGVTQTSGSTFSTNTAGSGGSHNHTFSGTAINLAVSYVDLIIASKD